MFSFRFLIVECSLLDSRAFYVILFEVRPATSLFVLYFWLDRWFGVTRIPGYLLKSETVTKTDYNYIHPYNTYIQYYFMIIKSE